MANVGECLAIAERIEPGDRAGWHRSWFDFAGGLAAPGMRVSAGHLVSARG